MGNKGGEELPVVSLGLQMTHERLYHIIERPAAYNNIIGEDEEGNEHTLHTAYAPPGAWRQFGKSAHRVGMRMTSDDELAYHHRHAHQHHAQQIYKDEGGTAIVAHLSGKAPHITQSYSTARSGKHYAQLASEVVSLFCHFLYLFVCPVGGCLLPWDGFDLDE